MQGYCGIDVGASAAKLVIIDDQRRIVARALRKSGVDYSETARQCLSTALSAAGLAESDVTAALATGYGRNNVPFAGRQMTEIACHGKGAHFHFRRRLTVIDIGAQDSKMIHLADDGRRTGFKMNRKCAAGTGAFLEEIAYRLDLPLAELNGLAERSDHESSLGSFCTVFAATEILEKIRAGEKVENIVKGAFRSVVKRIVEMGTADGPLVVTGGVVAHNPVLANLLGEAFQTQALVPPSPQHVGAFGAALFALENHRQGDPPC
ncbi:MAG: acyl-CoA dehydratase activase [Planctomycetota bacterium]|jgi:predicted CoA-substrate-specific enzyme activase